ncbi:MAG: GNAT family N-acetyltransferase [Pirellulales bacterium]
MTVGNLGSLEIRSVSVAQRSELLRWIHHSAMPAEFQAIEADYRLRCNNLWSPAPLEAVVAGDRVAAGYFSCLPGGLATLGGVRAINEQATGLAAQLLVSQIGLIRQRFSNVHMQAALDVNDLDSQRIVRLAGLAQLTDVDQLWLGLEDHQFLDPPNPSGSTGDKLHFYPASTLSRSRFERLLGETFDQTLDCPELNGIRSLSQVLDTFLSGKPFRDCGQWNVVSLANRLAGCLLLTQHNRELIELSYMGLSRWARGKRLGGQLIQAAQQQATDLGAAMLVVAADVRNWPAMQLYKKQGFQFHRRLRVFWHR